MYDANDYESPVGTSNSYSGMHVGREEDTPFDASKMLDLKLYIEVYDKLTITIDHVKDSYEKGYLNYNFKLKYKEEPIFSKKERFVLTKKAKEEAYKIMAIPLTRKEEYLAMIYKDM